MTPAVDAYVLQAGEGRLIEVGGFGVTVKAGRDRTGGAFTLIETGERTVGGGPPLHVHRDAAESFYVLAGEYRMHIDGRDFTCPAGAFIYIPRGTPHTFTVTAPDSRKLNLYTPAAMEGYFDDLGAAIRDGIDEAGLADLAERYEMAVLGPAPEGYL